MPWSRKKSCERCRVSKARCNKATPTCSRCSERQFQCVYDGRNPDRTTPYAYPPKVSLYRDSSTELSSRMRTSPEHGTGYRSIAPDDLPLSLRPDQALPDFDEELHFDWATTGNLEGDNTTISGSFDLLDQEFRRHTTPQQEIGFGDTMQPPVLPHIPLVGHNSHDPWSLEDVYEGPTENQTPSRMTVAIEPPTNQRTLMRRRAHKGCPLTSIVLGLIISYPKMMIEGDQLPPFIHPPCHIDEELAQDCAESGKHVCLSKNLAVCASLVRMFYERTAASTEFAWNSIYAEGERLRQEYHELSIQDRVTALQSSTVFLILQAEDPDSAAKNGVGTLLAIVTDMVLDLTRNCDWHMDIPQERPDRREWVFRESLRRILALVCIIDLLLEGIIVPSAGSCQNFRAIPLPSNRDLWGSRTNKAWRSEYARSISSRKSNKVLTVGDLIESDEGGCFTNSKNNLRNAEIFPDIVKWCERLDALGTLIWMVIPFEQYRRRNLPQDVY